MVVNETLPAMIEPISETINSLVGITSAGMGGIFILYVILLILKWKESRDLKKVLKKINESMRALSESTEKLDRAVSRIEKKPSASGKN